MRIIFLVVLLNVFISFAYEPIKIGFRAGLSLFFFNDDAYFSISGRNDEEPYYFAFEGGIAFSLPIFTRNSVFQFTPEINYIYKDFTWNVDSHNRYENSVYYDLEINFKEIVIGIPLLFQIKPNNFYVAMGAQLDIALISKIYIKDTKHNTAVADIDYKKDYRKTPDIGIIPFAYGFVINNTIKLDHRVSYNWPKKDGDYGVFRMDLGVTVYFLKW